jgi:hypothetical protein
VLEVFLVDQGATSPDVAPVDELDDDVALEVLFANDKVCFAWK